MIMATSKFKFTIPDLKFNAELKQIADRIFIPSLQRYMNSQNTIDGSPYPSLKPETIRKKRKGITKRVFTEKGSIRSSAQKTIESVGLTAFTNKTLFDTGKLFRSFFSVNRGKSTVVFTLKGDRKQIGGYLNPRFNFFGVSKQMERNAIDFMKKIIKEKISARS